VQFIFYGYGTNWHWCYYFTMAVQTLASFSILYSLRFRLATWEAHPFVRVWNVVMPVSILAEVFLPVPGFIYSKMRKLTPLQSATWTMAYYYVAVSMLSCSDLTEC
jgi:hypothetical protein